MSNRLAGKRALVTAAGQGMGRAAVLAFVREGAKVIATDVNPKLLEEFASNKSITPLRLDVTDDAEVARFVESTGAVDILFNCAGWVHQARSWNAARKTGIAASSSTCAACSRCARR